MTTESRENTSLAVIAAAMAPQLGQTMFVAEQVAKSGLFPGISSPQSAFALMLLCEADGLKAIEAIRRYHIIKGRPSMRADAMLASFQNQGGFVEWIETSCERCEADFWHPARHPKRLKIELTLKRFVEAGVAASWDDRRNDYVLKDTWAAYPDAMLQARAITKAVRMILPGVVVGIYATEEVQDFDDDSPPRRRPVQNQTPKQQSLNHNGHAQTKASQTYRAFVMSRIEEAKSDLKEGDVHRSLMASAAETGRYTGERSLKQHKMVEVLDDIYAIDPEWIHDSVDGILAMPCQNQPSQAQTPINAGKPEILPPLNPPKSTRGTRSRDPKNIGEKIDALIVDELEAARQEFRRQYPSQVGTKSYKRLPFSGEQVQRHVLKWASQAPRQWCNHEPRWTAAEVIFALEKLDSEHTDACRDEARNYVMAKLTAAIEAAQKEIPAAKVKAETNDDGYADPDIDYPPEMDGPRMREPGEEG